MARPARRSGGRLTDVVAGNVASLSVLPYPLARAARSCDVVGVGPVSLSGVDLNLLVALDALLTERNVTRAAERMSLGQPAMSAALARLRKQFGDPLLVREGRSYRLTTLAESLLDPVREAIAAADQVLGVRRPFDPRTDERVFSVMASDYVTLVLLRPLLSELAVEAPHVRITIMATGSDFDDKLRRGSADLLIYPVDLAETLSGLPRTVLFSDRFVLTADRDNPDLDDVDVERFRTLPYAGVSGAVPSLVESQLEAQGIAPRVEVATETQLIVPFLLVGTRLVGFVQERLVRAVAPHADLRTAPSPVELRPLVEAMYWTTRSSDDPAHRWLRARLVEQARRI
jgi:DNA-binding transcriptional LysR family regulator